MKRTIYTVPPHCGENVEVPVRSRITVYDPTPKPEITKLEFSNVEVIQIDCYGHYSPGPVAVQGFFQPGDKVKVTVEKY